MIDNAESYREFCLSLGEVEEKMPFGRFAPRFASVLALYVEGHMFTFADVEPFEEINLKVDPATVDELHATYSAVGKPMNLSPRHWISVRLGADMPSGTIERLLGEAYLLVEKKYRRRRK